MSDVSYVVLMDIMNPHVLNFFHIIEPLHNHFLIQNCLRPHNLATCMLIVITVIAKTTTIQIATIIFNLLPILLVQTVEVMGTLILRALTNKHHLN